MPVAAAPPTTVAPFINAPYTDFTRAENAQAMRRALERVRTELGKEYELLIAGQRRTSSEKFESVNPSRPSEVVGIHPKGTEQDARDAVEAAYDYFPTWAGVSMQERAETLLRAAAIFRERKFEFDAWLVYEAGKTWAEAEAEIAEAIDFCEYYARQAMKLAKPEPVVQLSGERDEMVYL